MKSVIYNIYKKLKVGNKLAHNIDLNSSIIEQLFEITTDNDDKYENLKGVLLEKTNINLILKQLIENRKSNYFKQNKLLINESKIIGNVVDLEDILIVHNV